MPDVEGSWSKHYYAVFDHALQIELSALSLMEASRSLH